MKKLQESYRQKKMTNCLECVSGAQSEAGGWESDLSVGLRAGVWGIRLGFIVN